MTKLKNKAQIFLWIHAITLFITLNISTSDAWEKSYWIWLIRNIISLQDFQVTTHMFNFLLTFWLGHVFITWYFCSSTPYLHLPRQ